VSLQHSIELMPGDVSGYGGLVLSRRFTEADRPLVARMLSRLEGGNITELDRMKLHFSLGKALEDLEDYSGAMQLFDVANKIRYGFSHFDRSEFDEWGT
jgi:hypothetical protein